MFKHWVDRSSDTKTRGIRESLRKLGEQVDWEDVFVFCHLTLAFVFIVWGLEIVLPWSIWRIGVGIYLYVGVGHDLGKLLWSKGFYLLKDYNEENY